METILIVLAIAISTFILRRTLMTAAEDIKQDIEDLSKEQSDSLKLLDEKVDALQVLLQQGGTVTPAQLQEIRDLIKTKREALKVQAQAIIDDNEVETPAPTE